MSSSTLQRYNIIRYLESDLWSLANLCVDQEIIQDMTDLVISEINPSEQAAFTTELKNAMEEIGKRSGGDFESSALALVQLRNFRFQDVSHFIALH